MSQIRLHAFITPRRFYPWLITTSGITAIIVANALVAPWHQAFHRGLVLTLLILALSQIQWAGWRYLTTLVVLTGISLDTTLSLWSWANYRSAFSYGFAQSVLDTDAHEALAMLELYWRDGLLFIGLLLTLTLSALHIPPLSSRYRRWPDIALLVVLGGYSLQAALHQLRSNNLQSPVQRVLSSTPFSNASVFLQVLQDQRVIASVTADTPDYALSASDTGIDTYVLIIGESERTANMQIYGYGRETTPQLDAERHNLLLFRHAVSAAPVTIMAVPLALTADTPEHHSIDNYRDNIIAVANQAGFRTFWFSRQGSSGAHNNIITAIASGAHQKQWVNTGYDDALLPLFRQALRDPGKKLIVLHLYGSHENACDRYPASAAVFTGGSPADDCYDNSVRFTDSLLGQVFSALQNTRASVLYFSDHALIRDPTSTVMYHHAGTRPPHEALEVPMFLWFSPQLAKSATLAGDIRPLWSTAHNNRLAELWLGIHRQGEPVKSLDGLIQQMGGRASVADTTERVYDWYSLPEHSQENP
ncbi:phosphoethanolamine transferase [Salmonella enterica]|uniref:phosphoethanolamine transferase n=1 Tax=Salmonella enterica TaxID=28901 RepID=UPI000B549061|nr:phosphoethanolamine transferase [Salmonella enterica]ECC1573915.1 phosphoethanolamine transferase [Salmonella enterica subsp. diarizonae]ASG84178.1 sulfatase [Salmonella enterica subsp. diarizonae serovar 65:c:z str. SA20044251]EBA7038426.1 phosphoethanolamine transferase [Salmonella enterica]ECO7559543.1 phosphoethanolamine transferase [Salmonella enterica]EDJ9765788.1 sulfatase [Salmonella enterica]